MTADEPAVEAPAPAPVVAPVAYMKPRRPCPPVPTEPPKRKATPAARRQKVTWETLQQDFQPPSTEECMRACATNQEEEDFGGADVWIRPPTAFNDEEVRGGYGDSEDDDDVEGIVVEAAAPPNFKAKRAMLVTGPPPLGAAYDDDEEEEEEDEDAAAPEEEDDDARSRPSAGRCARRRRRSVSRTTTRTRPTMTSPRARRRPTRSRRSARCSSRGRRLRGGLTTTRTRPTRTTRNEAEAPVAEAPAAAAAPGTYDDDDRRRLRRRPMPSDNNSPTARRPDPNRTREMSVQRDAAPSKSSCSTKRPLWTVTVVSNSKPGPERRTWRPGRARGRPTGSPAHKRRSPRRPWSVDHSHFVLGGGRRRYFCRPLPSSGSFIVGGQASALHAIEALHPEPGPWRAPPPTRSRSTADLRSQAFVVPPILAPCGMTSVRRPRGTSSRKPPPKITDPSPARRWPAVPWTAFGGRDDRSWA